MTAVTTADIDQFRAGFAEALRPLADPATIQAAAARFLGTWIGVNRAFYAAVEEDGEHAVISGEYNRNLVPITATRYRVADFGPEVVKAFKHGRTLAVDDVADDASLSPAERAAFDSIDVRAHATVFLRKGDSVVAIFGVRDSAPRAWTAAEIGLLEETAERTWAATARAHAEAAWRASEERVRLALDAASLGSFLWYPQEDRAESDLQMLKLFGLESEEELTLAEAMASFIHPDDRHRNAAGVAPASDPEGDGKLPRSRYGFFTQTGASAGWLLSRRGSSSLEPRRARSGWRVSQRM